MVGNGFSTSAAPTVVVSSGASERFGHFSLVVGNDTLDSKTVAAVAVKSYSNNCAVGIIDVHGRLLQSDVLDEGFVCVASGVTN